MRGVFVFVISKKRILFIISIIFISIISFKMTDNTEDIVEVVSLPVTNKTIVLDAGHGSPDERGRLLK